MLEQAAGLIAGLSFLVSFLVLGEALLDWTKVAIQYVNARVFPLRGHTHILELANGQPVRAAFWVFCILTFLSGIRGYRMEGFAGFAPWFAWTWVLFLAGFYASLDRTWGIQAVNRGLVFLLAGLLPWAATRRRHYVFLAFAVGLLTYVYQSEQAKAYTFSFH